MSYDNKLEDAQNKFKLRMACHGMNEEDAQAFIKLYKAAQPSRWKWQYLLDFVVLIILYPAIIGLLSSHEIKIFDMRLDNFFAFLAGTYWISCTAAQDLGKYLSKKK